MFRWAFVLWSKLLFAAKKRTGWIDFGETVYVTGTVQHQDGGAGGDGDWCFELLPDPACARVAQFQGVTKSALGSYPGCIECEVMPADRPRLEPALSRLAPGV